jgi:hypothetical protein
VTAKHALSKHAVAKRGLIDGHAVRDWAICMAGLAALAVLVFFASRL